VLEVNASLQEYLEGTYFLLADTCALHPISLTLSLEGDLSRQTVLEKRAMLRGVVQAQGLASRRPFVGTVGFWFREARLTYDGAFLGDDEKPYRLLGEKDLDLVLGIRALTRLEATIFRYKSAETESALIAWLRSAEATSTPAQLGRGSVDVPRAMLRDARGGEEFGRAQVEIDWRRDGLRTLKSLRLHAGLR
jgi:hypothetical protein